MVQISVGFVYMLATHIMIVDLHQESYYAGMTQGATSLV